jgi:transcriptional regulator with XRE-family HTH domain
MTEFEWLSIFSDNLIDIMNGSRISQRELAEMSGLSEATISNYVHRRQMPGVKALINIAYVLNCDLDDLMDFGSKIR